ncbi:hypothetical protein Tco_1094273 [Tanacetum coccineum]|uniref:Uncharacterized protein n=1 Tax=Tanacetum coccineum TaxID=301880 RepID=A0ABQ5IFJ6_9ASTR
MSEKAKDPKVINKNISHKPIDYKKLSRLTEDFGKRFTPQQELRMNKLLVDFKDKRLLTIGKLKDIIKSLREKSKDKNVKYDYCEIETKNMELENSVAKLLSENERLCNEINHVKQVFKEQFDSIKKTCVRSKEQSDSLIDKVNLKSVENEVWSLL